MKGKRRFAKAHHHRFHHRKDHKLHGGSYAPFAEGIEITHHHLDRFSSVKAGKHEVGAIHMRSRHSRKHLFVY